MAKEMTPKEREFTSAVENSNLVNEPADVQVRERRDLLRTLGVHHVSEEVDGEKKKTLLSRAKPEQVYFQLQTEYYGILHETGAI